MKEFDVTITETLKLTVSVEASSKEEAQQMVSDQWHAGDHILDADNFVEVEFESNDGKEISAERAPDDTIEVLMVEPGQYPRVERIGSDLASLQKAVDGYIEAVYPYDDPVALICGEEAKLEGKPLNRALRDGDGDIQFHQLQEVPPLQPLCVYPLGERYSEAGHDPHRQHQGGREIRGRLLAEGRDAALHGAHRLYPLRSPRGGTELRHPHRVHQRHGGTRGR